MISYISCYHVVEHVYRHQILITASIHYVSDLCYNCRLPRNEFRYVKRHYYSSPSPLTLSCKNRRNSHSPTVVRSTFSNWGAPSTPFGVESLRPLGQRYFSSSVVLRIDPKPSSKVEETVTALKEKAKDQSSAETKPLEVVSRKSIKQKIVDECLHYYHGFRLLFIDISVSAKLLFRIVRGNQLTRREHNLVSSSKLYGKYKIWC